MAATLIEPRPVLNPLRAVPRGRAVRPPLAAPRLSVVIVNYSQWEDTTRLVRQIRAAEPARQGAVEILVVDNHSPPHPLMRKLRRAPGVSLRRWARNRGYARAVNEGCRLSESPWVLLLNPDVTLTDGFVAGVLALMERLEVEDPRAGVVGFHLRNSDGSRQLSTGQLPSLLGTLTGLLLPRARRKYRRVHSRRRCRVPWVTGCCFLVRRDCLREVGGFDEDFFLYYEDVDFCRRAQLHGWGVWYEPMIRATHHRPLHAREVPSALRLCTRHGLLTYAAKHWGAGALHLLSGIVRLESWFRQRRTANAGTRHHWQQLDAVIGDLRAGKFITARRRVDQVMGQGFPGAPG